jgi:hypothetical protein
MPVLAEIVAAPALAAIAAIVATQNPPQKTADPCRPPAIRLESANIAALSGPDSPACKEAREREAKQARAAEKKESAKAEKSP